MNPADKKWNRTQIEALLERNAQMVERSILQLWAHQTSDEQSAEQTKHKNQMGFSAPDAKYFSKRVAWLKQGKGLNAYHLDKARTRIMKYANQLTRIANGEL